MKSALLAADLKCYMGKLLATLYSFSQWSLFLLVDRVVAGRAIQ